MAGVTALMGNFLLKMPQEKGIVVPGKEEAGQVSEKEEIKPPGLSFSNLLGIPCLKFV